jgi:hypothetical protein
LRGRKREAPSVNHALVVNVYAGITRHGVTDFHMVAGTSKHQSMYKNKKGQGARNITAEEYREVVRTTLLPGGRKLFSHQGVGSMTPPTRLPYLWWKSGMPSMLLVSAS